MIMKTLSGNARFFFFSLSYILVWSTVCAYIASIAIERDTKLVDDPWLGYFKNAGDPLKLIGSLFSFSLVFRFKECYDRWWTGIKLWGDIVSNCLDLSMQVSRWIEDPVLAEKFHRFLIVYSYACMCILKDESIAIDLKDNENDSEPKLIKRKLLTEAEMKEIKDFPGWQPHYCLEVMREIVQSAYMMTQGGYYMQKKDVKMHGQIYRCFDNTIKNLNSLIGECISARSAELPVAYDGIHFFMFFTYFTFAPIIWSVHMVWLVIPMSLFSSFIVLCVIVLGSDLVDPFGNDLVDIPVLGYCETIEAQVKAISKRFGCHLNVLNSKGDASMSVSKVLPVSEIQSNLDKRSTHAVVLKKYV